MNYTYHLAHISHESCITQNHVLHKYLYFINYTYSINYTYIIQTYELHKVIHYTNIGITQSHRLHKHTNYMDICITQSHVLYRSINYIDIYICSLITYSLYISKFMNNI